MATSTAEFGWYPEALDFSVGDIVVTTLRDLDTKVAGVRVSQSVDRDWIYAPPQKVRMLGGAVETRPYVSRIFGLPKTHLLSHSASDGPEHLEFLVWALSFFVGMRLTTTEAGFVDATPIRPHALVDFVLRPHEFGRALACAEAFWQANKAEHCRSRRWIAAVHALYMAQYPLALQFESFIYLYGALDACFALSGKCHARPKKELSHAKRVSWMCGLFNISVPPWVMNSSDGFSVSRLRNATLHESLFMGAPLGFALHGVGTDQNLLLEMEALICRLLVALIGDPASDYVRTPVNTRQKYGWSPSG